MLGWFFYFKQKKVQPLKNDRTLVLIQKLFTKEKLILGLQQELNRMQKSESFLSE